MFFSLQKDSDTNYSNSYNFGNIVLNTDNGWSELNDENYKIVFKGYSDKGTLINRLNEIIESTVPCVKGNFCVFYYEKQTDKIYLKHSVDRSFNLYYDVCEITNLRIKPKKIFTDKLIGTIDQSLNLQFVDYDPIGTVVDTNRDYNSILEEIYNILDNKVGNFVRNNSLPLQVYLSGGIDTMLVYSFIKKHTSNYQFADRAHVELDEFWAKSQKYIQDNYWAYNQIHHWRNATILASGAPGDEFMLRSPTTVNLYLSANKIDIFNLLDTNETFLHKNYFMKPKHQKLFTDQNNDPYLKMLVKSKVHTYKHICNVASNDHQHHHLGETLTFTPLRDLDILKLCLLLPCEAAIDQIMHSRLSKDLIAMNDPSLLNHLTTDKNNQNYWPVYEYIKQCID